MDDLRTGNKQLSFPTSEIEIQNGGQEIIAIGVKNTGDHPLKFKIALDDLNDGLKKSPGTCNQTGNATNPGTLRSVPGDTKGCFYWDSTEQTLSPGDSQVYSIKHFGMAEINTYMYKIRIMSGNVSGYNNEYASKTFFVKIS